MIIPEEFPYIKSLYVNDCYTYKDFPIELYDYKPFSHLILTGKNGSGKSTILRAIHNQFFLVKSQATIGAIVRNTTRTDDVVSVRESEITGSSYSIPQVVISFAIRHEKSNESGKGAIMKPDEVFNFYREKVFSYFEAKRGYLTQKVEGPSKESDFIDRMNFANSTSYFSSTFKQYLVNKKIDQAFAQIDQRIDQVEVIQNFFETLRLKFSEVFGVRVDQIDFDHKKYEFYLKLSDGRRLTFDTLSEGFSAMLSILMDLFMRVDLIRKQVNDYSYDPCGIVLIDEPETHLHLQLQEQVLPLLTSLFPNIQFIAATHSPAVIASIKNATIFDLTTKESRISEETAGRSYSDLMVSHFGLGNEYSDTADDIINKVNTVLTTLGDNPNEMRNALQVIYDENSEYLSPTLKVELELLIAQQKAQYTAQQ